jgi:hypothetical protein
MCRANSPDCAAKPLRGSIPGTAHRALVAIQKPDRTKLVAMCIELYKLEARRFAAVG